MVLTKLRLLIYQSKFTLCQLFSATRSLFSFIITRCLVLFTLLGLKVTYQKCFWQQTLSVQSCYSLRLNLPGMLSVDCPTSAKIRITTHHSHASLMQTASIRTLLVSLVSDNLFSSTLCWMWPLSQFSLSPCATTWCKCFLSRDGSDSVTVVVQDGFSKIRREPLREPGPSSYQFQFSLSWCLRRTLRSSSPILVEFVVHSSCWLFLVCSWLTPERKLWNAHLLLEGRTLMPLGSRTSLGQCLSWRSLSSQSSVCFGEQLTATPENDILIHKQIS